MGKPAAPRSAPASASESLDGVEQIFRMMNHR
jgi:hypothetical protein